MLLVAFASRYGYHRDELYFIAAGRHLAWSYPDQGPVTPLIARAMTWLAPDSLTALRLPSAVMAGGVALCASAIARELAGSRRAVVLAGACTAVASVVMVTGHLLSTTTFDLLAWAVLSWLIVRILRTEDSRLWLWAGLVTGVALLNKPLIAFYVAALGVSLMLLGPRRLADEPLALGGRRDRRSCSGSPWLVWQAAHGWPQLTVSSALAHGGSASSQPRWALLPFQFLLVSPVLAPVWIAGLVGALRRPEWRAYRFLGGAWFVLVLLFLITGGKPYYLAGMFPLLLAFGAVEVDGWLARGRRRLRSGLVLAAIASSACVSAVIALPVLPAHDAGPVIAVNPDAGETIGWPELSRTVARVYRQAGGHGVVFTENYGEAGAVDRFGGPLGLPTASSGHNALRRMGSATRSRRPGDPRGPVGDHGERGLRRLPARRSDRQRRPRRQRRARGLGAGVPAATQPLVAALAAPSSPRIARRGHQRAEVRAAISPCGRSTTVRTISTP